VRVQVASAVDVDTFGSVVLYKVVQDRAAKSLPLITQSNWATV